MLYCHIPLALLSVRYKLVYRYDSKDAVVLDVAQGVPAA
jgi:hypothetical protein